ncbi:SRPBCC family protein [Peterkaempfera bronchialis]|uniref:SRPBCC family protein n=1 Tax=Peterkaempfera bronchialis TaxID=2126346 RepID=A0A345SS62_9ACTN|nr:SRPBCC family protein [Peterkaempfera bronchialis]AXI76567.1 SRPBCC family protein [Peterkaempfera bronchialis]
MALFRIERRSALSADEAWRRMTDWERHADRVPLTGITVTTPPPTGVGTVLVARTGVGRAGFDDPMEIVLWEPPTAGRPGRCRLEKRGTAVLGQAEIEVRPEGTGSVVVWCEDLRVRGLPGLLDAPTRWTGRLVFGRTVAGLLKEA